MENEKHDISGDVLALIQKEHLTPHSKWRVFFGHYVVWTVSLLALLFCSASFGLFLTILFSNDWDLYTELHESSVVYGLSVVPYLWIIFIAVFYFYAKYAFNKTETGYRYEQARIVVGSIAVSILLGVAIYFSGIAQDLDDYFVANVPCYHQLTGNHTTLWSLPNQGLLSGTIATTGTSMFYLTDFNGRTWVVSYGDDISQQRMAVRGLRVKIVGQETGSTTFNVEKIRPWVGQVEKNHCSFGK